MIWIAGNDYDKVITVIFHGFQKRVNGFLTKVAATSRRERVGLIDKQNPAQCLFNYVLRLDRRLPNLTANQSGAVDLHQLPLGENPHFMVDFCQQARDGGFTGSWITVEHQVQRPSQAA